jgi:hypothetical protein
VDRKRQRTRRLVVRFGLAVVIAVALGVLLGREAREIVGSTEESAGDAAPGPPPPLAPRLRPRDPVAAPQAVEPEADRSPEVARDPVPEADSASSCTRPVGSAGDGTAVLVNLLSTGGGGASFVFSPDQKDTPLTPARMAPLGRDASLQLEGGWETSDEASLLVLGLAPGTYAVFARLLNRRPEVVAGAEVTVASRRASVRLELDPKRPEAGLGPRRRGRGRRGVGQGHPGRPDARDARPGRRDTVQHDRPAGVDLELAVDQFPGHRLFPACRHPSASGLRGGSRS